jgi:hypothetical protein
MKTLASFVVGKWQPGTDVGTELVNPAIEEPLAKASTSGLDMRAVL